MKQKFLILGICIILTGLSSSASDSALPETKIFAENQDQTCECSKSTKCLDLMTSMYNRRATLYNVRMLLTKNVMKRSENFLLNMNRKNLFFQTCVFITQAKRR